MSHIDNSLLRVSLYPHQIEGIEWMIQTERSYNCGLLADDMGLGKSYQCLSMMAHNLPPFADRKTTLIVVPLSLVQQWKNEIASKINLEWKVGIYHGDSRKKLTFSDYDVVITTYQCLAKDHPSLPKGFRRGGTRFHPYAANHSRHVPDISDQYGPLLKYQWFRVVLDECQFIKNGASLTAVAARALDSTNRWCLSGTPIQNNYEEVDSIVTFLFKNNINRRQDPILMIQSVTLRRVKEDVLKDFASKTVNDIRINLTKEEQYIYNNWEEEAQEKIAEIVHGGNVREGMAEILVLLLRWRQICDHPNLFLNTSITHSSKQQKILRILRNIINKQPGEKIVLFSHFVEMLKKYETVFKMLGWNYVMFTGSMNSQQREESLRSFRDDPTVRIILMSCKAGNVGLNLVNANHVILTEPWWNPFVDDQAIDRVHRIGQKKSVQVYKLIVKGTIEERILDIQSCKRNMFAKVFGGEKGSSSNGGGLSLADIMYLANM